MSRGDDPVVVAAREITNWLHDIDDIRRAKHYPEWSGQMITIIRKAYEPLTAELAAAKAEIEKLRANLEIALNFGDFTENCTDNKLASAWLDKAKILAQKGSETDG